MSSDCKKENKLPKASGKTAIRDLVSLPQKVFEGKLNNISSEALYTTEYKGLKYEFLWKPKPQVQNKIFVLFSGDAVRKKNDPPVFQRWSWANFFPGHVIYFSDPSLHLNPKLGLAWYAGTDKQDPLKKIASIVSGIADELNIVEENIVSYGSSGGGFAALRFSLFLKKISVICINPQVDITRYEKKSVEFYLKNCFNLASREEALEKYPERVSLLHHVESLSSKKIIYIQNLLDHHHYNEHYSVLGSH